MKFEKSNAPYIRYHESSRTVMSDIIIALLPLYIMAAYYYGVRAILLGAVGVLSSVVFDCICIKFAGKKINPRDLSAVVTGMILPLMMPATIPFITVVTAAFVAIAVAKHPFGGVGNNLFNPAATGYAFAALCWTNEMYTYPVPMTHIGIALTDTIKYTQSPAYTLSQSGVPNYDFLDMLLGNFPGPMGATHILVLMACMIFLIYRKTINWQTPVCFLVTAAVLAALFPRILTGNMLQSVMFELFSGIMIFTSVFILPEPVTSPKRIVAKSIYAAVGAAIAMIYRHFGGLAEGIVFGVLLLNALAPVVDRMGEKIIRTVRRAERGKA